ncbi:hypothetical protein HAX54_052835 [Datura stramonium]|uniref:Uncharacterized protein n=1 Tax=Datura stramonium TaxID=4076 RepID=A0ABS8WRC4_DATST|nr:hypothetical protein [Datura stramonium]
MGWLATVDKLQKFGIDVPKTCAFYRIVDETLEDLSFVCTIRGELWKRMMGWVKVQRTIGAWQTELLWASTEARKNF